MTYKATTTTSDLRRSGNSGWVSPGLRKYIRQPELTSEEGNLPFPQVIRFLLWNAPLMLLFWNAPWVATIHSVIVLLIGLHFVMRDEQPTRAAFMVAYIAGCEILWRGVDASLISEYGKYASMFLCILMIVKYRLIGKNLLWPILFLALLAPAVFIAPFDRQALSYQLAGPVALAIASITFGGIEFKRVELQRFFLSVIAPTIAMGVFVSFMLLTGDVAFSGSGEDEAITGGIGSNQVSSALGLGATAAFFYIFLVGRDRQLRFLMSAISLGLIALAALTFSRGGLWTAAGAVGVGALFLIRDRRLFFRILGSVISLGLLAYFVVFPFLNNLTGGTVVTRFSDFDSTGRDVLFEIDYQLFLDNPVLGVGVGQSPKYHISAFGYPKPTHTEYSRLLAEHGGLGLLAIILLAVVTLTRIFSRQTALWKGAAVGFTVWALLFMVHSATRMIAPSFAFGLAAARFLPEEDEPKDE